mgnify:CR=1 FL=1
MNFIRGTKSANNGTKRVKNGTKGVNNGTNHQITVQITVQFVPLLW